MKNVWVHKENITDTWSQLGVKEVQSPITEVNEQLMLEDGQEENMVSS